jgi:glycerophosphoryl diester phosphodiesterase
MPAMKIFRLVLIFATALASCSRSAITLPPENPDTNLDNTIPISDSMLTAMEGIYRLAGGNAGLGDEFVCKVSKKKVSFFSNKSGIFIILDFRLKPGDSSIRFSGYWRYSESKTQGLISLTIGSSQGASDLLIKGTATNLSLQGSFSDGSGSNPQPVSIQFGRAFSQYTQTHEFIVFGHHGVQTTADPPYAENSLNGILNDEGYGINGMEFDVHLTKDHIPICAHDASINIRVTEKGPLFGDYIQYSFAFLDSFVRLEDGQKIPSVEQVLNAFIDSTSMKEMWLDVKGDPDIFKYLEPVVKNAYARAAAKNRNVIIIADLPSQKVIDEFNQQPSYGASLPTMCELSLQDAINNHCQYFGPRYTLGLLQDDVTKAHSMGIRVYDWTLNSQDLIISYLQNGKFDGFITDYPAYVNFYYYTLY